MIVVFQKSGGFPDPCGKRKRIKPAVTGLEATDVEIVHRNIYRTASLPDNLRLEIQFPADCVQNFADAGSVTAAEVENTVGSFTVCN